MDASEWNKRYADSEYVWTIKVNQFVEQHLAELEPGTAIDLAAGECRNAVWLASRGWEVTAVDYSEVGLDKGRKLAQDNLSDKASNLRFVCADATTWQAPEPVDLVLLSYLQLENDERTAALRHAKAWLNPGGRIFVIAHDQTNVTEGYGGPPSKEVCYDLDETVETLSGLRIEVAEVAERIVDRPDGRHIALDTLVMARND